MTIRSPRDFWAGAIYLALALAVIWMGRELQAGSSARMGPGYFPTVLGSLLAVFGIVSMVRSFIKAGAPIEPFAWKPMALVLGATVLFGLLLDRLGLLVALPCLIVVSSLASRYTRPDLTSLAALAGLVAFCILVFVRGLGVPMPVVGPWLGG